MEGLYQNKYRVKSARLEGWDYGADAYYFVTICIHNRVECLGGVMIDNNMSASVVLSGAGKIARDCWLDIPNHFPNASLDEWVIMPNHMHGIVVIGENNGSVYGRDEAMPRLYRGKYPNMSKISPKPKSLPVIIGSFKSIVTKTARRIYPDINFHWQSRFYDHIVRNKISLQKIREYIKNNPKILQNNVYVFDAPTAYPQYTPDYYAMFFIDFFYPASVCGWPDKRGRVIYGKIVYSDGLAVKSFNRIFIIAKCNLFKIRAL